MKCPNCEFDLQHDAVSPSEFLALKEEKRILEAENQAVEKLYDRVSQKYNQLKAEVEVLRKHLSGK